MMFIINTLDFVGKLFAYILGSLIVYLIIGTFFSVLFVSFGTWICNRKG